MPYSEIQPPPSLCPWVECFWWSRRGNEPAAEQRVLPDGCADLIFDRTENEATVVGTMTRPLVVMVPPRAEVFGVRFRPGRAAAFLRLPLAEITDARVPLGDIWKGWSFDPFDLGVLEAELLRRLDPDRDRRVDQAVERIISAAASVRIDELAQETGLTRQHLARQFRHHVGISPKAFVRVMRFRAVVDAVHARESVDWADVAAQHGYYDQSHLIGEFRELAGATPAAFHFSNR